jgi:hypothetical protein
MTTIYMAGTHDSGAACLAMVMGLRRAEDTYPWLGYDPSAGQFKGVLLEEICSVLRKSGLEVSQHTSKESVSKRHSVALEALKNRHHLFSQAELATQLGAMVRQHCAVVAVSSLVQSGQIHYVFCRSDEVYDPSNAQRYIGSPMSLPILSALFIKRVEPK